MTEVFAKVGFLALAALNGAIIFTIMDVKGASWMQSCLLYTSDAADEP